MPWAKNAGTLMFGKWSVRSLSGFPGGCRGYEMSSRPSAKAASSAAAIVACRPPCTNGGGIGCHLETHPYSMTNRLTPWTVVANPFLAASTRLIPAPKRPQTTRPLGPERSSGACGFSRQSFRRLNSVGSGADLRRGHILSLQTLRSFLDLKLDFVSFFEFAIAIHHDRREMHENILPVRALDESVPFLCAEPLDYSCFFHCSLHKENTDRRKSTAGRRSSRPRFYCTSPDASIYPTVPTLNRSCVKLTWDFIEKSL